MLFVVTVVFVVTFMPALAMTVGLIGTNFIIFYLYFVNNAANPIIYSFMNQNFRKQLWRLVGRGDYRSQQNGAITGFRADGKSQIRGRNETSMAV